MNDRILFMGTSGDELVTSKQLRASGGIIINAEGYQFHIDPGPGTILKAKKYHVNLRENTAVLVSHAHINHCNDVNAVLAAMSHNNLDTHGVLIANSTFVNGNDTQGAYLTNFHKKCVERIIVPKHGQHIGIENIEIILLKCKHSDSEALGFKIITPKFSLVYAADTAYSPDLIKQYEDTDILILNVVQPFEKKDNNNLSSDDAVNIIKRVNPKLAIITHFGKDMIEASPVYQARDIHKLSEVNIIAAEDGMQIDPLAYTRKTRQEKLESYDLKSL